MIFRKFAYWFPLVVWMAVIFWMSTGTFSSENTALVFGPVIRLIIPGISTQEMTFIHDLIRKCGHISEYFVLGFLFFRFFRNGSHETKAFQWMSAALISVVLYAATDEFHQSFLSSRTASAIDVGIDTLGGFLAQLACGIRYRYSGGKYALAHDLFGQKADEKHIE